MLNLEALYKEIRHCRKCLLWRNSENAVPGEGPENAAVMLIGQNPGKEEDEKGRPFVGKAGKYLDEVLENCKINRKSLFITSVVKHRTPENRAPTAEEVRACMPYLIEQINLIKPKIVVLMGNVASKTPRIKGVTYIKTYHPTAATRFPKFRKKFEDDLKKLKG